jgi:hypothetical protein
MHPVLKFSDKISCLPVVHGSGDFAIEVRRVMLSEQFDCVAVPLPRSFQQRVEEGIHYLPRITIVMQEETEPFPLEDFSAPDALSEVNSEWRSPDHSERHREFSYVPIDPCQPVIAGIRLAMQEHVPRAYIDMEVEQFEAQGAVLPDPYALKQVPLEKYAAAVLPAVPPPRREQHQMRVAWMAQRLRQLERSCDSILFICSVSDWPWIREAYRGQGAGVRDQEEDRIVEADVHDPEIYGVDPATLIFLLGELPFITGLYESARATLDDDENLSVDGIKELLLAAREAYQRELKNRGRKISPHLLSTCLKYIRNLCLVEKRMTPDLYTLIIAAKQIAGDQFAISLAETAREYRVGASGEWSEEEGQRGRGEEETRNEGETDISSPQPLFPSAPLPYLPLEEFRMSIGRGQLPNGEIAELTCRLPGHPVAWRNCELKRKPLEIDKQQWAMRWNPFTHCSWPPEDVAIERFRTHVKDRALSIMGNDLAKVEKFTTSLKDGLDIRETLRNWHTGDLYVKEMPPSRGSLDCVIMLFDSPADPRDYPWRITWHAEHQDESTLSFFATHFSEELVGPGIAMATYGGAMFLFPPRPIRDIWQDGRFDYVDTLEERLLAAACHHAAERHIAVLSTSAPGIAWRRLAKRHGKRLVHVPLAHFSQETVQQLRMFHVLNGHQVRSYAEHFIRKA